MLCGLLSPSSGSGKVGGFDILSETEQIKLHIGYMSQKFSLYEDLSVAENINFYGGMYGLGGSRLDKRKSWALEMAEQGITVFVTTHYMEEAEYCDRIALIYDGQIIATGSPMELKTHFMHEKILDLRCPNSQSFIEPLKTLPEIRDVSLFGSGLHLVTPDDEKAMAAIYRLLNVHNIARDQIRLETILPSMEDVFISLIEEADRNEMEKPMKEPTSP